MTRLQGFVLYCILVATFYVIGIAYTTPVAHPVTREIIYVEQTSVVTEKTVLVQIPIERTVIKIATETRTPNVQLRATQTALSEEYKERDAARARRRATRQAWTPTPTITPTPVFSESDTTSKHSLITATSTPFYLMGR